MNAKGIFNPYLVSQWHYTNWLHTSVETPLSRYLDTMYQWYSFYFSVCSCLVPLASSSISIWPVNVKVPQGSILTYSFSHSIFSLWLILSIYSSSVTTLKGIIHTFVSSAQTFSLHSRPVYLIVYIILLWSLKDISSSIGSKGKYEFSSNTVLLYWSLCQGMLTLFIQFWKVKPTNHCQFISLFHLHFPTHMSNSSLIKSFWLYLLNLFNLSTSFVFPPSPERLKIPPNLLAPFFSTALYDPFSTW